jgi:uncharacterized membrane protein YhhN
MSLLRLKDNMRRPVAIAATGLFLCSAVIYFAPLELQHKIAIPVSILSLASLWLSTWQITLALVFSAAGDYFGSAGNLMAQIGCFAVAHIWFITYFAKLYNTGHKTADLKKGYIAEVLFCSTIILATVMTMIVPHAPAGILRTGVTTYACMICTMLVLAMLQKSLLFRFGAILFVLSDFILAWSLFVNPIPYGQFLIMIPYYAAQWMIYKKSTSSRD